MKFLEKDLEEIIYENPLEIKKRGLYNFGGYKIARQLTIGKYGVADIVTFKRPLYCETTKKHKNPVVTIYELKKDDINEDTFFQAIRYARGIQRFLFSNYGIDYWQLTIEIILIGKEVSNDLLCYLPDIINCGSDIHDGFRFSMYTYNYNIDGIHFQKKDGYKLIDEGF